MKHARGFFLALAILIMPNAAYYVFNWILVLKRQINEENFLRLPLYVDYIPEAIILVACAFYYLCGKRLHKGGEVWLYGGADYTAYQPCNKQRRIYEHRACLNTSAWVI